MTPDLDTWIHAELPQLIQAYRETHPDFQPGEPDAEFGAFQTYRRYVEAWPFARMLRHEQTQGTGAPQPGQPGRADIPLVPYERIFLQAGQPFRWKGVSAFRLIDRYAKGENLQPFFDAYAGFNLVRVFPYVPVKDWGASAWETQGPATMGSFLKVCEQAGFYVECCVLTDDDPARLRWAQAMIPMLTNGLSAPDGQPPVNLLLEAGNEPRTNKQINTAALRTVLEGCGCLFSSGDYEESSRHYGSFLTCHTGRDSEWPRRAHDLVEYYGGGGPNSPSDPAHRVPVLADEPIRPDQAGYNDLDFYTYAAACSILGAGATFHSESGKLAQLPSADEARCAAAFLRGLNVFPADAALGGYGRPENLQPGSLRSYTAGDEYLVRIRPTNRPGGDWLPLDADGICWVRG